MLGRTSDGNVGAAERVFSVVAGAALVGAGAWRRGWSGLALGLTGAEMIRRGVRGWCEVYGLLGISTADSHPGRAAVVRHHTGIRVERAVTIDRPAADLYHAWRDLPNLPQIMTHLVAVEPLDGNRSRWTAKAPAGGTVSWEAEIYREEPDALLAWRSLPGAGVPNAGAVRFVPAPGGRGTEVHVELEAQPPAGRLGALAARLFGEDPDHQVQEDLRRFKRVMETGEVATGERRAVQARVENDAPVPAAALHAWQ